MCAGFPLAGPAFAQDLEGPRVSEGSFTPATVDLRESDQAVTVRIRVQDETGVSGNPYVAFESDESTQYADARLDLVQGTTQDGIWEGQVLMRKGQAFGTWTLVVYGPVDTLGNRGAVYSPRERLRVSDGTTTPDVPKEVTATASDESASISWLAPNSDGGSAITAYQIVTSPGGTTTSVAGSARTATVTGLVGGQSYTFTVAAVNKNGVGNAVPSNAVTPTVAPDQPPGAVGSFTTSANPEKASISLRWEPPSSDQPITSYTVTLTGPTSRTVEVEKPAVILRRLKPGIYKANVTATSSVGTGPMGTVVTIKLKAPRR